MDLMQKQAQREFNEKLNRQPVQLGQRWSNVINGSKAEDNTRCSILCTL